MINFCRYLSHCKPHDNSRKNWMWMMNNRIWSAITFNVCWYCHSNERVSTHWIWSMINFCWSSFSFHSSWNYHGGYNISKRYIYRIYKYRSVSIFESIHTCIYIFIYITLYVNFTKFTVKIIVLIWNNCLYLIALCA
jgi:hypothetical protein